MRLFAGALLMPYTAWLVGGAVFANVSDMHPMERTLSGCVWIHYSHAWTHNAQGSCTLLSRRPGSMHTTASAWHGPPA